jgi:hypothetical protein
VWLRVRVSWSARSVQGLHRCVAKLLLVRGGEPAEVVNPQRWAIAATVVWAGSADPSSKPWIRLSTNGSETTECCDRFAPATNTSAGGRSNHAPKPGVVRIDYGEHGVLGGLGARC